MNFKKFGVSKNVMPSANAKTESNNGITITCDGEGRYYIKGTATANVSIYFDIESFTIPVSVGSGENGTFSMFNDFYASGTATGFYLYNGSTQIDLWRCTSENRTSITYVAMGGKTINRIRFTFESGFIVDGVISPMFTNDGQLPVEFEPHMVWHGIPYYIRNTSTDTLTLPSVIYGDVTNATITLKGNEEHTGTPSPQNPVTPNGVGERTGNLLNKNDTNTANGYVADHYLDVSGNEISYSNVYNLYNISTYIEVEPNTTYTFSDGNAHVSPAVCEYTDTKVFITGHSFNNLDTITFTTSATTKYVRASVFLIKPSAAAISQPMLNAGSTALPYEPYGVKIPILSNSITYNKYLGEEQTTRQIKKLVLTGDESITAWTGAGANYFYILTSDIKSFISTSIFWQSNAYEAKSQSQSWGNYTISCNPQVQGRLVIKDVDYSSVTDFKAYLQQQYANGTPVTVWYVLATPTTGIVNEPLMKIGSYADSLTTSIATTDGANSLSVDTQVQPSEVTAGFHGWHPVSGVHEYDNDYTIAQLQTHTIAQLQTHTISELEGGWI